MKQSKSNILAFVMSVALALPGAATTAAAMTLQILHASDLEGGVEAIVSTDEDLYGRAPNFAAVVEALEADAAANGWESVLISAGDNFIPGPIFSAGGDLSLRDDFQAFYQKFFNEPDLTDIRETSGRVDMAFMTAMGFDASALGNHEFDAGTSVISDILGTDIRGTALGDVRWPGSQFPYLSSNLDFGEDSNLAGLYTDKILPNTDFQAHPTDLAAGAVAPKIAAATVIERGGERIGVIGGTTPLLETISSPGDTLVRDPGAGTNDMDDLATILQPIINDVLDGDDDTPGTSDDINKVILSTHLQQIALEQALVTKLSGVDVVLAGGSDTLMADDTDALRPGDVAVGDYPFMTTNLDGDPALVVCTDGQYAYVGRLVVSFDADGVIQTGALDPAVSGAYATDDTGVSTLWGPDDPFGTDTKGGMVKMLRDPLYEVIQSKDGTISGTTAVFLEGRREKVRTEETNLGNLTADANLAAAKAVDATVQVSIKNGGGIRAAIGQVIETSPGVYELAPSPANPAVGKEEGEISQLDIENSLRFNDQLTLLTLTADGLRQVLEHAVSATAPGATPGQFPQVAGVCFSFDPAVAPGSRVQSAAIVDADGNVVDVVVENGAVAGDPSREIRAVTLGFMADGGDGYPFDTLGTNPVDTGIDEQTAMADHLAANFKATPYMTADQPKGGDARIQQLDERGDTVTAPVAAKTLNIQLAGQLDLADAGTVAHDPVSQKLFVTGAKLQVIDFSDPANLILVDEYDIGETTSVAAKNGLIAAAVPADPKTDPGKVVFLQPDGTVLKEVPVGALPDMLTFTPDGKKVLVANEGEPNGNGVDPAGSVSLIDLSNGVADAAVQTADFTTFDGQEATLRAQGVRIFPGKSVSEDVEPESIAVSADGATAFVTLQEANAFGVLDIAAVTFTAIKPLGLKDHALAGNTLDASDLDGRINLQNWPVFGMYMPDAVASFDVHGATYYVTANEGDDRGEDGRIKDLTLDPAVFPDADSLQKDENIGRLGASTVDGDTDGDGDYDELYVYGSRSFSIWDATGDQVFDSGDDMGMITANVTPALFNANDDVGDPDAFDTRSDAKGAEPEGATCGDVYGHPFTFVGLGGQVSECIDSLSASNNDLQHPTLPLFR